MGDTGGRVRSVYDYMDYRDLLKAVYEDRKAESSFFSYRIMADILGLDTSYVFRILHKNLHLPARCTSRAIDFLGLTGRAAEYFILMTAYARERNRKERTLILEKAMTLRDVARRRLEEQELSFLRDWWVVAVRCVLEIQGGRAEPADIASRIAPTVPVEKVAAALELLQDLGIVKLVQGRLKIADLHLTADGSSKSEAVSMFQHQVLQLASESLERFPRGERDISTLTVTVDHDAFSEIREMLRECRRQIQKRVEESKRPDRVMQIAMAFFPIAPAVEKSP